jgi:two-component system sensor histidine kinase NblS
MLTNLKVSLNYLNKFWLNFRLPTKLLLGVIVMITFTISNLAFWSISLLHQETLFNNARLTNNISNLISANLSPLTNEENLQIILSLCQRFYANSPIISYIMFFDPTGQFFLSVPFNLSDVPEENGLNNLFIAGPAESNTLLILRVEEKVVGILVVGINSSQHLVNNSKLIWLLLIVVLALFWLTLILGTIFTVATITKPLAELAEGIRRIAIGNFSQKVTLAFGGELVSLILQFNEMGLNLRKYNEKNLDQILDEKIKLESVVGTIIDGTLLLDTRLRLLFLNEAALKIFSLEKKQRLVGSKLWEHLPPQPQKKMYQALEKLIETGSSQIFYSSFPNAHGAFNNDFYRIILRIVYDYRRLIQRPRGISITVQESTKELRLVQMRSQFMANISHELRTPLFNIRSFIETTQDYNYSLTTQQKRQFLDTVNVESTRLTQLVNNILTLSQLDSIKIDSFEYVDLKKIVKQSTLTYQLLARAKQTSLRTKMGIQLPLAGGQFDLIAQVVMNLIGNSLKFTYPNGEIIVRAYTILMCGIPKVRIEILDTGIGVSPAFKKIILNRFIREENRVHNLNGTGLGLAIVEAILKEHQASLHIITKQHVGSVFWFDLSICLTC